jgi:hypothetical protein
LKNKYPEKTNIGELLYVIIKIEFNTIRKLTHTSPHLFFVKKLLSYVYLSLKQKQA